MQSSSKSMWMQSSSKSGRVACLPIGITSVEDQVCAVEKWAISSTPCTNLCPGDRRCHWKYSQLRCIRTFRKMFSCHRRSDRRESDGMGHVCSTIRSFSQSSRTFSMFDCSYSTRPQSHFVVVNCSDALMSVFYSLF